MLHPNTRPVLHLLISLGYGECVIDRDGDISAVLGNGLRFYCVVNAAFIYVRMGGPTSLPIAALNAISRGHMQRTICGRLVASEGTGAFYFDFAQHYHGTPTRRHVGAAVDGVMGVGASIYAVANDLGYSL